MTDRETLDVYDARARDYADNFCKGDTPDTQLQSFLSALPEAAHVLDLGCGPGQSAAILARHGHSVTAMDASAEMVKLAAGSPGVTALQATFDDLTGADLYDGIWANFSLLHAARADLPRHLSAIAIALRPLGLFHIGMKLGSGMHRDTMGRRYTFVREDELEGMLLDVGLHPFARWTGKDVGFAGTKDPWIVMQARRDG